ncbi:hypothetical protein D6D02_08094 [Aureobasidium pullulans]|nr:hypothetical protein D6D02_08094 [Aureobasidium pullulans]
MDSLWKKAQERLSDADLKLFKFHRPDSERREILEDILKAVQAQSDRCLHKRWKIKGFNGKDIVLRDVCGKMFSWVNQFLTVIDVAAQYDPVHASLPWAGIRFFLQLSINDAKTFDAMIEGLEIISRVVTRYGLVEILYMKGTSDAQKQLREQLIVLYAAVLRYLCKARRFYSHNTAARMVVFALRPPELDEALKQIVDQEVVSCAGSTEQFIDLFIGQATLAILATDTKAIAHGLDIVLQDVQAQLHKLDAPLVRTISQISALQIQRDGKVCISGFVLYSDSEQRGKRDKCSLGFRVYLIASTTRHYLLISFRDLVGGLFHLRSFSIGKHQVLHRFSG